RDPGKFQIEGSAGVMKGAKSVVVVEKPTMQSTGSPVQTGGGPSEEEKRELSAAAENILRELEKQEAFARLRKNINFQLTPEGLRIILNESENSAAFFEPGSDKLLQKSAIILITIARELGRLANHIVVEGHTDAAYSGGPDYSNWELSSDRANAARRLMEVSGLYKGQVKAVRGYADKLLMFRDNPLDERNRRVTLVVLYKSEESRFDQLAVGADIMADIKE
ncbi:MAG TPA: OmpA family protein, partial [Candidatus Deferrimicrobium sp.]|nr:OmpA family protein [Candidatus Deferrimicrobium sp.]